MTTWDLLTANSTLTVGTAWEHLNNQRVGGGTGTFFPPTLDITIRESTTSPIVDKTETEQIVIDTPTPNISVKVSPQTNYNIKIS